MTLGEGFDRVLTAARLGSEWAWEALYKDLAPLVRGYLSGRGAREPDDLTGEVFVSVVRNLEDFSGDERALRTWVLTIAHRRFLDSLRQGSRRVAEVPLEGPAETRAGPGGDVEQEALERLSTSAVLRAITTLSEDQQAVLMLRIVADLTVEEVAAVVGKRPGAVKALQRRALRRLQKDLGSDPYPSGPARRLPE